MGERRGEERRGGNSIHCPSSFLWDRRAGLQTSSSLSPLGEATWLHGVDDEPTRPIETLGSPEVLVPGPIFVCSFPVCVCVCVCVDAVMLRRLRASRTASLLLLFWNRMSWL